MFALNELTHAQFAVLTSKKLNFFASKLLTITILIFFRLCLFTNLMIYNLKKIYFEMINTFQTVSI